MARVALVSSENKYTTTNSFSQSTFCVRACPCALRIFRQSASAVKFQRSPARPRFAVTYGTAQ